jgi:hypothetical protein
MGIAIHELCLLRYANKKMAFKETVTIGRQTLHVSDRRIRKLVGTEPSHKNQRYCEALLTEFFGATKVDSIDNSDYENATYIHNMNEALPNSLSNKYDTIIDAGTLEHIYNAPQAFKNCSLLSKLGGQILHILPANNCCGHGFWQFSPELFFSLYSEANGYSETEVFVADQSNTKNWYQVKRPTNGKRVEVSSSTEVYVLVRTVLSRKDFSHINVQQSDYVYTWESTRNTERKSLVEATRQRLREIPIARKILKFLHHYYYHFYLRSKTGLDSKNPGLTEIDIESRI